MFVDELGPYYQAWNVDLWGVTKDAKLYRGPFPVIAHPPCERWGSFFHGRSKGYDPSTEPKKLGDDGGCFKSALESVRKFGGVIEHPAGSRAWKWFGLNEPPRTGGWVSAGDRGWTCCVPQGNYGHRGRKLTYLYAVDCDLPSLDWKHRPYLEAVERMGQPERRRTPMKFMNILLGMAGSVRRK